MFVRIVVKSLKAMITKKENTVVMSATSMIDLKSKKGKFVYDKWTIWIRKRVPVSNKHSENYAKNGADNKKWVR